MEQFDYNQNGAYFITICVKGHKPILSKIVGTVVPTGVNKFDNKNSTVAKFVSTFKRFCNIDYGENIWQGRYCDHIIRNQDDYNEVWEYIEQNPQKWVIEKQGKD